MILDGVYGENYIKKDFNRGYKIYSRKKKCRGYVFCLRNFEKSQCFNNK